TTIASSPHEPIRSKSLVIAGSRPLCNLPCRRVEQSEIIGPRLGENNFAVFGYGQPVLTSVLSRRDGDRISLPYSGARIDPSNNRAAIAGVPNVSVGVSRHVVHANVEAR